MGINEWEGSGISKKEIEMLRMHRENREVILGGIGLFLQEVGLSDREDLHFGDDLGLSIEILGMGKILLDARVADYGSRKIVNGVELEVGKKASLIVTNLENGRDVSDISDDEVRNLRSAILSQLVGDSVIDPLHLFQVDKSFLENSEPANDALRSAIEYTEQVSRRKFVGNVLISPDLHNFIAIFGGSINIDIGPFSATILAKTFQDIDEGWGLAESDNLSLGCAFVCRRKRESRESISRDEEAFLLDEIRYLSITYKGDFE